MGPLISIVILNWNAKKMTEECVNSLLPQINKNFELVIVDNGSSDGSAEYLQKKFKDNIKLVKNIDNKGYAGGNNSGIKKSSGDYILVLNNDTVFDKNFLREIWKNKDKADILGVKSYYYDKKNILWSVGSSLNKVTMKAKLIGDKEKDNGQFDKNFSPSQIAGVCMLINKNVIKKIGDFNEDYFLYMEETEFQIRAKKSGFNISWIPSAKLYHKVGFSSGGGRTPMSAYYLIRNRGYLIKKYSKLRFIAYLSLIIETKLRVFYGILKGKSEYSKKSIRGFSDFLKNKKGLMN